MTSTCAPGDRRAALLGPREDALTLALEELPSTLVTAPSSGIDAGGVDAAFTPIATALRQAIAANLACEPAASAPAIDWDVPVARRSAVDRGGYFAVLEDVRGQVQPVLLSLDGRTVHALLTVMDAAPIAGAPLDHGETALLDSLVLAALVTTPPWLRLGYSGGRGQSRPDLIRDRYAAISVTYGLTCGDRDRSDRSDRGEVAGELRIVCSRHAAMAWQPTRARTWDALARAGSLALWTLSFGEVRGTRGEVGPLALGDVAFPRPGLELSADHLDGVSLRIASRPHLAVPISVVVPPGDEANAGPGRAGIVMKADTSQERSLSSQSTESEPLHPLDDAIADAPIAVRFEIGGIELSAEQLSRLRAGDVIDPGVDSQAPISIVIGRHRVGHAELVRIENRIGLRVISLGSPLAETEAP